MNNPTPRRTLWKQEEAAQQGSPPSSSHARSFQRERSFGGAGAAAIRSILSDSQRNASRNEPETTRNPDYEQTGAAWSTEPQEVPAQATGGASGPSGKPPKPYTKRQNEPSDQSWNSNHSTDENEGGSQPQIQMHPEYSLPSYWEERYATTQSKPCEWYLDYSQLRSILLPYLPKRERTRSSAANEFEIFIPGCGTSQIGEELYKEGYRNVSAIDISSCLISDLRHRYRNFEKMDFSVMDATVLSSELPRQCFDLIFDKALLDALLCGEDGGARANKMLWEMLRLLKPGGSYICVSHSLPEKRLPLLEAIKVENNSRETSSIHKYRWEINQTPIPNRDYSQTYHVYCCKKKAEQGDYASTGKTSARRKR
eukprot:gb/GECG01011436.1/.p1 GENE.gb/GECG01011436.1/~~gb/GECG01011436.1/.p1  ORF type:complete len:369 (+),score=43.81 gb/GECG01011436.1/:1-1107(+)